MTIEAVATETSNVARSLHLSDRFVTATLVERPDGYPIDGRVIVVNPNLTPVHYGGAPPRFIPAFSSTILVNTRIERADSVLLFSVTEENNIADIVREPGWSLLGDMVPGFPLSTPLWRGPQHSIGSLVFDPAVALGETTSPGPVVRFDVKVNLWFAPAGTDCSIHDRHDFIEVHSQIHGLGRMQKFETDDHATLYEDLLMSPGYTTPVPFCRTGPDGGFVYPWHQYRADVDCVWLAIEYHAERPIRGGARHGTVTTEVRS